MKSFKKIYFEKYRNHEHGFTILEIIVTIVLAAIASTVLIQFMRSQVINSVEPVILLQQGYRSVQGMENITIEYRTQLENGAFNISNFESKLSTYAADDVLSVVSERISFNSEGDEIALLTGRYLKVTVADSHTRVISLFAE